MWPPFRFNTLADQADRNSRTDVVYEPPPAPINHPQAQQQQQPQPNNDKKE
jgi:hypothetical protein